MSWFEAMRRTLHIGSHKEVPGGIWIKCESCGTILLKEKVINNLWVCDKCNYHFKITPNDYITLLIDEGTFSMVVNTGIVDMPFNFYYMRNPVP